MEKKINILICNWDIKEIINEIIEGIIFGNEMMWVNFYIINIGVLNLFSIRGLFIIMRYVYILGIGCISGILI